MVNSATVATHSQIPNDVTRLGFRQYTHVERVLKTFGKPYRLTRWVEYLFPRTLVGRTAAERAAFMGVSKSGYNSRLTRVTSQIRELQRH